MTSKVSPKPEKQGEAGTPHEPDEQPTSPMESSGHNNDQHLTTVSRALIKMRRRRKVTRGHGSTPFKLFSPLKLKTKGQTDAGGEDVDDDEEAAEHISLLLVIGALVIALAILCLGVWSFSIMIAKALQALNGTDPLKLRHLIKDVMKSCTSQDCRTAAYALTDSVRTRGVNPCSDFYQFCCGLWNVSQQGLEDGGNHSGTYQQWLEDRYVAHVNTRMLELLKSKNTDDDDDRNDPSARRVARSYQSCIAFFANTTTKGHLSSMWHAANLNTDAWMQVSTFSALFQLMVRGILESHLPSALMIRSHKDGTVDVYPGSPIDMYGNASDLTSALLDEASTKLGLQDIWALNIHVKHLDEAVRALVHSAQLNVTPLHSIESDALDLDEENVRCVQVAQFHFDRELQDAVAEDEESQDREADTVIFIWKHVRGQALDLWNVSTGLELNRTILRNHITADQLHYALEPSDEDAPSLKEAYGPDFLSNLVLNTRLTGNQINFSRGLGVFASDSREL
ncbi:hypothetical protein MRX96_057462 [Rhipicephalus microplus]